MPACGVLNLRETAEVLGVSTDTLERRARRGEELAPGVEAIQIGRQWRVSRRAVERLLGQVLPEDRDEDCSPNSGVSLPSSPRRSPVEPSGCSEHPSGQQHDEHGRAVA